MIANSGFRRCLFLALVLLVFQAVSIGSAQAVNQAAINLLNTRGLLLIPESTNDRVMAFHPDTGDLVDDNFILDGPAHLRTPICAIKGAGYTVLVSDQTMNVVQQYDLFTGGYIGVFAPAGGVDTSTLENIRGIAMSPAGHLLVTVGSGANAGSVAEFDASGNYLGNFIANGAGGLDGPSDIYFSDGAWLVSSINTHAILRYDAVGAYLGNLAPVNNFPEQISSAANGNILAANYSGIQTGVMEFTPGGVLLGIYNPASAGGGNHGVYELENGNILTANSYGVYEIDRLGYLVDTKISGVSARFIEFIPPEPLAIPSLNEWGMIILAFVLLFMGVLKGRGKSNVA
jgi:hypothetical protein